MSNEVDKARHSQVPMPLEGSWSREAAVVRSPLGSFLFGLRARANMRALQIAGQHARAVGALMDIAVETMDKMQRAQDRAREFTVREAHHELLCTNEAARLQEALEEERHQRDLAGKRRERDRINAAIDILVAKQTQRAKKKFERLKHQVGEERFKTEAARRKVGAAEAELAMRDARQGPEQAAPSAPDAGVSKAAAISEELERVRTELQAMRADGEDSDERRALIEEEAALERLLAKLLKRS